MLLAIKWLVAIIFTIAIVKGLLVKYGGWKELKELASEKVRSWYNIPFIGFVLRVVVIAFTLFFRILAILWKAFKVGMVWMGNLPVLSHIKGWFVKLGHSIATLWSKLVVWSETK